MITFQTHSHSNSDNTEIMFSDEADEVIKEFFGTIKNICQNNFESMKVIK